MPRFLSSRFRTAVAALAAAFALVPATARAQAAPLEPASSSTPGDPSWDGAVKGALLGAGAMAGVLTVGYANCDAGCEAPAEGPMFAWGMGVGAGGGAAVGWLIDKLHKGKGPAPVAVAIRTDPQERSVRVMVPLQRPRLRLASLSSASMAAQAAPASPPPTPARVDDSLVNGGLIGAGVGAGVGVVMDAFLTTTCDVRNCTPISGTEGAAVIAAGAGVGLLTGLLIDKARTDPPVAVSVRANRDVRAVRVDWRLGATPSGQADPRPRPRTVDDSTVNGLVAGTAIGTIGGLFAGMGAVGRCGGDLCNRPPLHTYLLYGGFGAGTGAFTGWLIDKLHKAPAALPDAVAVSAGGESKAVHMQWRF